LNRINLESLPMNTGTISNCLATVASELVNGAPKDGAFVLNRGDAGMLASLDRLSAAQASASSHGGATIAAHAEHVAFGLSLINRWAAGEANPWADADWAKAWRRTSVTDAEWKAVRDDLREQGRRWVDAERTPREVGELELNGLIGSIAHVGYHLGAIRQIEAHARGPKEGE
jgi:hypothetical protein